jgi:hypothetical protein
MSRGQTTYKLSLRLVLIVLPLGLSCAHPGHGDVPDRATECQNLKADCGPWLTCNFFDPSSNPDLNGTSAYIPSELTPAPGESAGVASGCFSATAAAGNTTVRIGWCADIGCVYGHTNAYGRCPKFTGSGCPVPRNMTCRCLRKDEIRWPWDYVGACFLSSQITGAFCALCTAVAVWQRRKLRRFLACSAAGSPDGAQYVEMLDMDNGHRPKMATGTGTSEARDMACCQVGQGCGGAQVTTFC